jgi:hypothetical protein
MRVFLTVAGSVETNHISQQIDDLESRVDSLRGYL